MELLPAWEESKRRRLTLERWTSGGALAPLVEAKQQRRNAEREARTQQRKEAQKAETDRVTAQDLRDEEESWKRMMAELDRVLMAWRPWGK